MNVLPSKTGTRNRIRSKTSCSSAHHLMLCRIARSDPRIVLHMRWRDEPVVQLGMDSRLERMPVQFAETGGCLGIGADRIRRVRLCRFEVRHQLLPPGLPGGRALSHHRRLGIRQQRFDLFAAQPHPIVAGRVLGDAVERTAIALPPRPLLTLVGRLALDLRPLGEQGGELLLSGRVRLWRCRLWWWRRCALTASERRHGNPCG
jgi:hypothetical protein